MADIASNMTFARWLRARTELILDYSDDFLYAIMAGRGIEDDSFMLVDASEKQRDLCLADIYYGAAVSSVKTGTQGESDGGWTHYVAIKNAVNRDGLMAQAKALYDKWGEPFFDTRPKIRMKNMY
jgi:hypothetical protein